MRRISHDRGQLVSAALRRSVDAHFDAISLSSSSRPVVALLATRWRTPIRRPLLRAASPNRVVYNQIEDE